jgi:hypothetical protein
MQRNFRIMKADHDFPLLMTAAEAADYLAVPVEAITLWLRDGKLLVAARGENGVPLIYRWRVKRDGPHLAMREPVRVAKSMRARSRNRRRMLLIDPKTLACGCSFADSEGALAGQPIFLCSTARGLESSAKLAQAFVAVVPDDPFFVRLATVAAEALRAHFASDHIGRRAAGENDTAFSGDRP